MEQPLVLEPVAQIPTLPFYNSMRSVLSEQAADREFAFNIVYVIGVGGTGGFLVPHLSRYIASLPYSKYTAIVLVDGDMVERKNIIRQNFVEQDIEKNKAQVLASRYSSAFGVPIIAVQSHLTEENIDSLFHARFAYQIITQHLLPDVPFGNNSINVNYMVISCVDNNKTRNLISHRLNWYASAPSLLFRTPQALNSKTAFMRGQFPQTVSPASVTWIDSGNESTTGQVICSYDTMFTRGSRGDVIACNVRSPLEGSIPIPFNDGILFRDPSSYFSAMLDSCFDWEQWVDSKDKHEYSMFMREPVFQLTMKKDQVVKSAAAFYFASLTRPDAELNTIEEMKKTLILGDPSYGAQLGFLVGLCSQNGWAPFQFKLTPPITYHYPTIFASKDKLNTELSCAERAMIDPQNLMVNAQAATFIMNYVSAVLAPNPMRAYLESFGCAWSGSNCQELYFTKSNMESILGEVYDRVPINNYGPNILRPGQTAFAKDLWASAVTSTPTLFSRAEVGALAMEQLGLKQKG